MSFPAGTVKEYHGIGNCDCCLSEGVWVDSLLTSYKVDGIDNACEECGEALSNPVDYYGFKSDLNKWEVKHIAIGLRVQAEKDKARRLKAETVAAKWINWVWSIAK